MALDTDELRELRSRKTLYRDLQRQADEAKRSHDTLQAKIIEEMKERGDYSYKGEVGHFSRKSTIYGHIQDREKFHDWLRKHDLDEEFLRETEEAARVNELVRGLIDNGEELPPGVGFYTREYISITDSK